MVEILSVFFFATCYAILLELMILKNVRNNGVIFSQSILAKNYLWTQTFLYLSISAVFLCISIKKIMGLCF